MIRKYIMIILISVSFFPAEGIKHAIGPRNHSFAKNRNAAERVRSSQPFSEDGTKLCKTAAITAGCIVLAYTVTAACILYNKVNQTDLK